ncbi:MAG: O-methyltransferase [Ferruginibacter sp.]|nr:O-methyltransferase [Ferruginibacter sp.]
MGEIVQALAEEYAAEFSEQEDMLLSKIAGFTNKNHPHAHMLSGQVQGAFLSMVSNLMQPLRILEIGTFTGYSALCLAKGLRDTGVLHTIEIREEDAATSRSFFAESSYADKIVLHVGDAKTLMSQLNEEWDLVFIDADKTGYIDYYELVLPALRKNGVIIADNVLFHGQVLENPVTGKNALAIQAFNKHVQNDDRVEQVLLTVRDGLLIIRKL